MSGIPVLCAEGDCIARAWENALVTLYESGCDVATEYDASGDLPSKDATMILTVHQPLAEPMIHRDFPGGFVELQEYVMEVCEGIKNHWVRDPGDPSDTRWEYTYHQRLFGYAVPTFDPIGFSVTPPGRRMSPRSAVCIPCGAVAQPHTSAAARSPSAILTCRFFITSSRVRLTAFPPLLTLPQCMQGLMPGQARSRPAHRTA